MERKRVVAIAPYEGLATLITEVSQGYPEMDVQIFVGDLEAGASIIRKISDIDCDLILSRGGTATLIEKSSTIPVVDIQLSEYDIVQAVKLAQSFGGRFCVVGFANIIARVETICDLIECPVHTSVVQNSDEVAGRLTELKNQGYSLVVGDAVTVSTAKSLQIHGILLTSGRESVVHAFSACEKILQAVNKVETNNLLFQTVLDHSDLSVQVYAPNKKLLYSNVTNARDEGHALILSRIPHCIDEVLENGKIRLLRKAKGSLWTIKGVRVSPDLLCFYIKRSIDITSLDQSISIRDMLCESDAAFHPFYRSEKMKPILHTVREISKTNLPVLIFGEPGTGKDTLAHDIHKQSRLQNNSFLTINCRLLGEKQLAYLLRNENSPLGEADMGIYFKNIHYLSSDAQQMLVAYLRDTSLHRRNRVIYSHAAPPALAQKDLLVCYLLHEMEHDCMTVFLPSLHERQEDIPGLASIYINELNVAMGKQIAGLDGGSIELLQNFQWAQNIDQLIRVLKELVLTAKGAFIQHEDTLRVLKKESILNGPMMDTSLLEGSLEEITAKIIQRVLQEENMNQTRAAKRLGIGRSTMWRRLKI